MFFFSSKSEVKCFLCQLFFDIDVLLYTAFEVAEKRQASALDSVSVMICRGAWEYTSTHFFTPRNAYSKARNRQGSTKAVQ